MSTNTTTPDGSPEHPYELTSYLAGFVAGRGYQALYGGQVEPDEETHELLAYLAGFVEGRHARKAQGR